MIRAHNLLHPYQTVLIPQCGTPPTAGIIFKKFMIIIIPVMPQKHLVLGRPSFTLHNPDLLLHARENHPHAGLSSETYLLHSLV
jgi:hypothetical protein